KEVVHARCRRPVVALYADAQVGDRVARGYAEITVGRPQPVGNIVHIGPVTADEAHPAVGQRMLVAGVEAEREVRHIGDGVAIEAVFRNGQVLGQLGFEVVDTSAEGQAFGRIGGDLQLDPLDFGLAAIAAIGELEATRLVNRLLLDLDV